MAAGDKSILDEARARFKRCREWEKATRALAEDDDKFFNADSDHPEWQWPQTYVTSRLGKSKPCLVINKTRQHCLQIINDARQNKSSVKVIAVGDGASAEAAKVFEGIYRHIEYASNGQAAYDTARVHQVVRGVGYVVLRTRYVNEGSFDQEIVIDRIPNPDLVYLDPDIQQFDGSDSRFGFVFRDLARDEAEARYPWLKRAGSRAPLDNDHDWDTEKHVREASYYRRVERKLDTLVAMPNGGTALDSGLSDDARALLAEMPEAQRRDVTEHVVEWFKIVGDRIVERRDTPFASVPIARFVGEEAVIDGKLDRKGHVRALKDPQRMYNYWSSTAAEMAAMQTRIPWTGPADAIEGYETYWEGANTEDYPYLPWRHVNDEGQPIPPPQRVQPPVTSQAAAEGMQTAANELMLASGQYQADMGAPSNERSGAAIQQRQRAGDNATYHYVDHEAQAMRYIGRLIVDAAPKVYDTKRLLLILNEDGSTDQVTLDPDAQQAHQEQRRQQAQTASVIFNPSIGRYGVESDVGPSYATRRQETFNALSQIMAQNQEVAQVAGDLLFKAADFPLADEVAERLFAFASARGFVVQPGQPSPQVMQLQRQLQQVQAQAHQMVGTLMARLEEAERKLKDRGADQATDDYRAETERMKAVGAIDPTSMVPVVRQLASAALGQPILPLAAGHAAADGAMAALSQPPQPTAPTTITPQ